MKDGPTSLVRLWTSHWIRFFLLVFWAQRRRTNKSVKTLDQSLGPHVFFSNCCLSWRYLLLSSFTNLSASWMTRFVLMSCFLIFLVCWLSSFCSSGVGEEELVVCLYLSEKWRGFYGEAVWRNRRASRPRKNRKKRDGRERAMEQSGRMRTQCQMKWNKKIGQREWENW